MTATSQQGAVVLTSGGFYGTLAAARSFGRRGFTVTLADGELRTPTRFSRYVRSSVRCPDRLDFEGLRDWLVGFGKTQKGSLLYPCSDDHAWVVAKYRDELSKWYTLYQPPLATIEALLNKEKLYTACARLGIPTPPTYFPRNDGDLERIATQLSGRFLVKPKTQVGMRINKKAEAFDAGPGMASAYHRFREAFTYNESMIEHDPSLAWPMLQQFRSEASRETISIAGFVDEKAGIFCLRASQKVLQYPINIGVGLGFAGIEPPPALVERVRRICQDVDYFGVFEVEFIKVAGARDGEHEYLLMDFNPRFYGQMQFEISRGLDLPGLVEACARGDYSAASGLAARMATHSPNPARFANGWLLKFVTTTQWMGRRLSWKSHREWARWVQAEDRSAVDQVHDRDDLMPLVADIVLRLASYVKYPRSSLRTLFGAA